MSFQPPADTLTYEPYFGLNEKPFSLTADPRFVYDSPSYVATCERVLAGIRRREGLLVLTGEIGTGKTTLCRAVIRDLGRKTYSSLMPDPFASREDLLKTVLIDFGVLSIQELTAGALRQATRTELGYLLAEFLDSLTADDFAVVIIDEAQNLALPLIEETRILSDTFGARGRLQIVFVGQPELRAKLKLPEMRQVDQRVCGYHRLTPLGREAVTGYIQHRLQAAGGSQERVLFPPPVVDVLYQRSGGVPRLINRVCDRALQIAFERQAAAVDREILDTALIELGSATLSPTWDAIVSEIPSSPLPASAAAPAPVVDSAPVRRPVQAVQLFQKEIDLVAQDLASVPLAAPAIFAEEPVAVAPEQRSEPDRVPPVERRSAPRSDQKTTARRGAPTRSVTTDWPRDVRSETYLQKLGRKWMKRTAIAAGLFLAVNVAMAGASFFGDALTPPVLPALPEAPALALPALVPIDAPKSDAPRSVPVAVPASSEYLVAVGLFASPERAEQVLDALTQAGLPAMLRPIQLRRQQVQQIALGPYFSFADATADLRRLQGLGGYDDANVIDSARESSAQ